MKMIRPLSRSRVIVARLKKQLDALAQDTPDHLGMVSYRADESSLDGGFYGDPHEDPRPDFVQKDDIGWLPLKR